MRPYETFDQGQRDFKEVGYNLVQGLTALRCGADTEFSLTFEAQAAAKCPHCRHHVDLRGLNCVGDGDKRWE
jgi:hypothetical protein